ncbi:MAG TPA: hypothetical protein VHH34_14250, partial [Pseudonocardiaceae bacterium]|nr:hypothetical protein [Pseudonocardiaceae bacterium]
MVEALVTRIFRDPQGLPATELGAPTHCLAMGGRIHSCLLRAELLAELLRQGLQVGRIWGLGSHRPLVEMEHQVAAALELGPVTDELDAVCAALHCALRLPDLPDPRLAERSVGAPSEVRRLATAPTPVAGLAAERGPGNIRATTSDTYRFFLRTAGNITARDHILVITSAIDA